MFDSLTKLFVNVNKHQQSENLKLRRGTDHLGIKERKIY